MVLIPLWRLVLVWFNFHHSSWYWYGSISIMAVGIGMVLIPSWQLDIIYGSNSIMAIGMAIFPSWLLVWLYFHHGSWYWYGSNSIMTVGYNLWF